MLISLLLAAQIASSGQPGAVATLDGARLIKESVEGKAVAAQLETLRAKKTKELTDKRAAIQALMQQNGAQGAIDRAQVELQRMTQDAETELSASGRQLQSGLFKKLQPVLKEILEEDHLGIIFEIPQTLVAWSNPAIDITTKVIQRLDAAAKKP